MATTKKSIYDPATTSFDQITTIEQAQAAVDYWKNQIQSGHETRANIKSLALASQIEDKLSPTTAANAAPAATSGPSVAEMQKEVAAARESLAPKSPEVTNQVPITTATPNAGIQTTTTNPITTPVVDSGTPPTPKTPTNDFKMVKGVFTYNGKAYTGLDPKTNNYYVKGKLQSDADIKNDFIKNYGAQAALVLAVPELSTLVTQAVKSNYTKDQYGAAFLNTTWAKQHPGSIGTAEIQRLSDPSGYNIAYNRKQAHAQQLANELGANFDSSLIGSQIDAANINNADATKFDQAAVTAGKADITTWMMQNPNATDAEIQQHMAKAMLNSGAVSATTGGTIFNTAQSLASIAQQYGQSGLYNQGMLNSYAANVAAGTQGYDVNTFMEQQKQNAMNIYKPFANQIAAGATVSSLADPYVNTIQNLLEVSPSDVQLGATTGYGAMVSKAMMGDGTTAIDPLSFANTVRSQPEWLNTKNAQSTLLGNANSIIQKMGLG